MKTTQAPYVLHVDDEEADILLLKHVFERLGIDDHLEAVSDGQVAIDYLSGTGKFADREAHPLPSLVLLDLNLPGVNGMDVLEWIRRQPALRKIVVVMFSSSRQTKDVDRAYELGANSYVQKSCNLERTVEMAKLLKGWWLEHNCFASIEEHHSG